jgi:hypothetical protein
MCPPKITKTQSAFSLDYSVVVNIRATPEKIWQLLTDAEGFPRWNSTITRIEGQIREGEKLRVHVRGAERTFTPKISDFVPSKRMTWTGGVPLVFQGVRTFRLTPCRDGSVDFAMQERMSGVMLPPAKKSLPDFGPIFQTYASDLKREAERIPV